MVLEIVRCEALLITYETVYQRASRATCVLSPRRLEEGENNVDHHLVLGELTIVCVVVEWRRLRVALFGQASRCGSNMSGRRTPNGELVQQTGRTKSRIPTL